MPASRLYSPSGTPQQGGGEVDRRADEILDFDFDFSQFASVLPNQQVPLGRQIVYNQPALDYGTFYAVHVSSITGKVYTVGFSNTLLKSFLEIIHPTDAGSTSIDLATLIPDYENGEQYFLSDEDGNVYMFISGNAVTPQCFKIAPDNTITAQPQLDILAGQQLCMNYKNGFIYNVEASSIKRTNVLTGDRVTIFDGNGQTLPLGYIGIHDVMITNNNKILFSSITSGSSYIAGFFIVDDVENAPTLTLVGDYTFQSGSYPNRQCVSFDQRRWYVAVGTEFNGSVITEITIADGLDHNNANQNSLTLFDLPFNVGSPNMSIDTHDIIYMGGDSEFFNGLVRASKLGIENFTQRQAFVNYNDTVYPPPVYNVGNDVLTTLDAFQLQANERIIKIEVVVKEAFNSQATIEIGKTGDLNQFVENANVYLDETGKYINNPYYKANAAEAVKLTVNPVGSIQGRGTVILYKNKD